MSGRVSAATTLTLVKDKSGNRQTFNGPVLVAGERPASGGGSPTWLKQIFASSHPDENEAFKAASAAAMGAHGPNVFTFLSSSTAGLQAQLLVVGEPPMEVAATRMFTEPASGAVQPGLAAAKPLVTKVIAWTNLDFMTAQEAEDFKNASH